MNITAQDIRALVDANESIQSGRQLGEALGYHFNALRGRSDESIQSALDYAVGVFKDRRRIPERDLIQLVANGLTLCEVAGVYNTSRATVDNRFSEMRRKYGCDTTTHLVAHAFREGWIK